MLQSSPESQKFLRMAGAGRGLREGLVKKEDLSNLQEKKIFNSLIKTKI